MEDVERAIGYRFNEQALLTEALTHSSYGHEKSCPFNERLEFLGDSVLGFVVSRELFRHLPNENEGTLSKLKSVLISAQTLARFALKLNLGHWIRLGKGEQRTGGRSKINILADTMEALIGAILMDGGLHEAERFIHGLYGSEIRLASLEIKHAVDFKTLLQERLQERGLGLPNYLMESEDGPAHSRTFRIRAEVGNYRGPIGEGNSKKSAQQECARLMLEDRPFWELVPPAAPANRS